jgi:serine protease AprX
MKRTRGQKTTAWLSRLGKTSAKGKGAKQVALALAATTKLDAEAAKEVMGLAFSSRKIGLRGKAGVRKFKRRLIEVAPEAEAAITKIPDAPELRPRDVAAYLNQAAAVAEPMTGVPAIVVKRPTAEARKRCVDAYGKAFGEKASDRLIDFLDKSRLVAARETVGEANPSLVLEFTPPALAPERESVSTLGHVRVQRVAARRDAFYAGVAPLRSELEKRIGSGARESALDLGSATDVCWLNGSLRAAAAPNQIADMASDASLNRIGLPRFLIRELNVTNLTVGAAAYRAAQQVVGQGITIAVIDGEVDPTHAALAGRVLQKRNFTPEAWGTPDKHATGVAGIIASVDATVKGMAPAVAIANYKIFASDPNHHGTDFDGALAIQQALEDGVMVVNCSWGAGPTGDGTSREARACDNAWDLGLVVVKSAGNKGPRVGSMTSPADARGVIVVGATDRRGRAVETYSSRGPAGTKAGPDLVAPGGSPGDGIRSLKLGGGTGDISFGTSFAAPHVAGLVGLLLAHDQTLTPDTVKAQLLAQCRPLTGIAADAAGSGLVVLR